ncbi:MAG: type I secretion system permease/ATPase, partial [Alphaproteobacteria bacterium]
AVAARWRRLQDQVVEQQRALSERSGFLGGFSKALRLGMQILAMATGAYLFTINELSPGAMIAASIVVARGLAPVDMAIGGWRQAAGAREAYGRVKRLLETRPLREGAMRLPRPVGALAAERVGFRVGDGTPILTEVSFALGAGESLGVIGPSGAGKTTLLRLLIGALPPSEGVARIDGAEAFAWRRDELGAWIGYLPQEVELIAGTVRDNIARLGVADDRDVVEAARLAGAHDMILRLPHGYETDIGTQGLKLSGGQRQRIGLARALFGRPPIVALDEPNSNLDAEGEAALLAALAELKRMGTTIVVVGHRPSTVAHMDKLLVLNQGRVEMFGPRAAVLARGKVVTIGAGSPAARRELDEAQP